MSAQIIQQNGQPAFAVIPFAEWEAILARLEDIEDREAVEAARHEETFPIEFVERCLSAESKVKVWREYRGLTLQALAEQCGVTRQMLSMLEHGKTRPSAALLGKLAVALGCDMEDLQG
jgi:DNA-binding XRE family transcriptional regulator